MIDIVKIFFFHLEKLEKLEQRADLTINQKKDINQEHIHAILNALITYVNTHTKLKSNIDTFHEELSLLFCHVAAKCEKFPQLFAVVGSIFGYPFDTRVKCFYQAHSNLSNQPIEHISPQQFVKSLKNRRVKNQIQALAAEAQNDATVKHVLHSNYALFTAAMFSNIHHLINLIDRPIENVGSIQFTKIQKTLGLYGVVQDNSKPDEVAILYINYLLKKGADLSLVLPNEEVLYDGNTEALPMFLTLLIEKGKTAIIENLLKNHRAQVEACINADPTIAILVELARNAHRFQPEKLNSLLNLFLTSNLDFDKLGVNEALVLFAENNNLEAIKTILSVVSNKSTLNPVYVGIKPPEYLKQTDYKVFDKFFGYAPKKISLEMAQALLTYMPNNQVLLNNLLRIALTQEQLNRDLIFLLINTGANFWTSNDKIIEPIKILVTRAKTEPEKLPLFIEIINGIKDVPAEFEFNRFINNDSKYDDITLAILEACLRAKSFGAKNVINKQQLYTPQQASVHLTKLLATDRQFAFEELVKCDSIPRNTLTPTAKTIAINSGSLNLSINLEGCQTSLVGHAAYLQNFEAIKILNRYGFTNGKVDKGYVTHIYVSDDTLQEFLKGNVEELVVQTNQKLLDTQTIYNTQIEPLFWAAIANDNPEITQYLLNYGADPKTSLPYQIDSLTFNATPAYFALLLKHIKVAKLLLKALQKEGYIFGSADIIAALQSGDMECLDIILANCAPINLFDNKVLTSFILWLTFENPKSYAMISKVLTYLIPQAQLPQPAENTEDEKQRIELVQSLPMILAHIIARMHVTSGKFSLEKTDALTAVAYSHIRHAVKFVQNNNIIETMETADDTHEWLLKLVTQLLPLPLNVNNTYNINNVEWSLLTLASISGNVELTKQILAAGADLSLPQNQHALDFAARFGNTECFNELLKYNPNLYVFSTANLTALMYATLGSHVEIIRNIIAHAIKTQQDTSFTQQIYLYKFADGTNCLTNAIKQENPVLLLELLIPITQQEVSESEILQKSLIKIWKKAQEVSNDNAWQTVLTKVEAILPKDILERLTVSKAESYDTQLDTVKETSNGKIIGFRDRKEYVHQAFFSKKEANKLSDSGKQFEKIAEESVNSSASKYRFKYVGNNPKYNGADFKIKLSGKLGDSRLLLFKAPVVATDDPIDYDYSIIAIPKAHR